MLTIPTIFAIPSGGERIYPGVLFQLPEELMAESAIQEYLNITTEGWHETCYGYRTYVKIDEENNRCIFPGLRIKGHRDKCTEFDGYDTNFDERDIESYALTFSTLRDLSLIHI